VSVLTAAMTENDWLTWVVDVAKLHGWRVGHFRPARTVKGWRTPVQGDKGFADLVLARAGVVLVAELKTDRGRLTPDQRAWLAALGPVGVVWRPRDRDLVLATLRNGE
jgi:hypothetical protein